MIGTFKPDLRSMILQKHLIMMITNSNDQLTELGVPELHIRWLHSYLTEYQQLVKIGELFSRVGGLNGGMLHGTRLGVYLSCSNYNN